MKKIILFICSLVLCYYASVASVMLLERALGADLQYNYVCDPRPNMWISDPLLGYRNKPNYEHRVFGNITGKINEQGFRRDEATTIKKEGYRSRVIVVGDSMAWGTRVDLEDSFSGILEERLSVDGSGEVDVLNTGVVGYCIFQQYLFLKNELLSYDPDVVLFTMMDFDHLPTEDPFGNARQVSARFLQETVNQFRDYFTDEEVEIANRLMFFIEKSVHVRDAILAFANDKKQRGVLDKVFIEIPLLQMKRFSEEHPFRLIVLNFDHDVYLDEFMNSNDIEFVAFPMLFESPQQTFPSDYDWYQMHPFFDRALEMNFPHMNGLKSSIDNIRRFFYFNWHHSNVMHIDTMGHPSRKGHYVIAENIMKYLV